MADPVASSPPLSLGLIARAVLGWLALALGAYALAGWIGSSIARNGDWREPAEGVEIMVETNGVHTAIVMPLDTPQKDWREEFPPAHTASPDRPYTHVSVSWGERQFYLETPTWADLSPLTVLRIATVGGPGLTHAGHYVRPAPGPTIRPLRLRPSEYAALVRAIEATLAPRGERRRYRGYGSYDVFYEARGRYTPVRTCNQWTSDMLAEAGARTGWWTPFPGGVMKWVPQVGPR